MQPTYRAALVRASSSRNRQLGGGWQAVVVAADGGGYTGGEGVGNRLPVPQWAGC